MSRLQWIAAAIVVALLGGLLAWQHARERRIAQCHATGGYWNGPASRCVPLPGRLILKRELDRS